MWPWLLVLAASAGILAAIAWDIWPWVSGVVLPPPKTAGPTVAARAAPGQVRARIFLPDESRQVLTEEDREITGWQGVHEGVERLLAQLVPGRPGARAPLPPGAGLRHVYYDAAGILYLDFDPAIARLSGGEWMRADLATSAVGLTLVANLGEVKRIQFLAGGAELPQREGGMDFRRPFTPRFPGEESASEPAPAAPTR